MTMREAQFAELRRLMLVQIAAQTIYACGRLGKAALARRVLEAMEKVPRHEFVPPPMRPYAYADTPLPIGYGKTISQPFIVALMTDLLAPEPTDRVLEVGTGMGYQAAVLAELVGHVYTVELIEDLAAAAHRRLVRLGYRNVEVRSGNGAEGWPEAAPFDKIVVTAAPALIPPRLLYQLKPGGRMVIPTGLPDAQQLVLVQKDEAGVVTTREILPVRFSLLDEYEPGAARPS
ncbi:MAG: protein-L-isoaspartate(D-aspartate) O-methyltransferase [Burkholderiaceae bacterium]|nr:protein-L-isoaspartate(D-aspartate) O-methyltransferase [Burkholderiaceae bacterium]